jgi:hypothetical protein
MRDLDCIETKWLPQSPANVWHAAPLSSSSDCSRSRIRASLLQLSLEALREVHTQLVPPQPASTAPYPAAGSLRSGPGGDSPSGKRRRSEDTNFDTAQPIRRRLFVFNLFALEGLSIAEALGCASLAVSPCLVPYAPPRQLQRRFATALPDLFIRLKSAPAGNFS